MLKWGDLHASAHTNVVPCNCTTEAAAFTADSSKDWRGAGKEMHLKAFLLYNTHKVKHEKTQVT